MLQLFPCKKGAEYLGCQGRKDECSICYSDFPGYSKMCGIHADEPCSKIQDCVNATKKYRLGRGLQPTPVQSCPTVVKKRAVYIGYLLHDWNYLPNKEQYPSYIAYNAQKGSHEDAFNERDLDIIGDKIYLDQVLIPKRLDTIGKRIIHLAKTTPDLKEIAKNLSLTNPQVRKRYNESLLELARIVKIVPETQKPDPEITVWIDMHHTKDVFEQGAKRYNEKPRKPRSRTKIPPTKR